VVIEAMTKLMREDYANVHRGLHYLANASTEAYEAAAKASAASSMRRISTRSSSRAPRRVR
jgi:cysteine desulfurase/selenocysteine lyase